MKIISFFFRHPHSIYFSIEKLFHTLTKEILLQTTRVFIVNELDLPFTSKLSTLRKNILFVRNRQSDINHISGDVHYSILGCSRRNINILTIHDCVLLYRYKRYNPRYWIVRWLWYQLPVKKADVVTVISQNTKNDLLRFTNCNSGKIRIIPNFLDPSFTARPKVISQMQKKLLFIGTAPNKNLERTVEAIQGMDIELLIVGYLNEAQKEDLSKKKVAYRLQNSLSDQEMRDIYAEADIMVFPSIHEGFGLPIIEAQATGRPVLTSRIEPMASVAGDGACLVDPYSSESIRAGLKRIIENEVYANELVDKGFRNVERFQISKIAQQYIELYQEMIKQKAS